MFQYFAINRINEVTIFSNSKSNKCDALPVFIEENVGMSTDCLKNNTKLVVVT